MKIARTQPARKPVGDCQLLLVLCERNYEVGLRSNSRTVTISHEKNSIKQPRVLDMTGLVLDHGVYLNDISVTRFGRGKGERSMTEGGLVPHIETGGWEQDSLPPSG